MPEPDEEIDDTTFAADHITSRSAPSTKHSNAGAGKAQTGDQPSSGSKSSSAFKNAPTLSENIEKIRQSIRTAIETTEWSDQPTSQQPPHVVRRGSFSSSILEHLWEIVNLPLLTKNVEGIDFLRSLPAASAKVRWPSTM